MRELKSYFDPFSYSHRSFSPEGEDLTLARIFKRRKNGFYVDIGSYDPIKLSNTFYFYRRGWRGITIDARPGSSKRFREIRPRDISLEIGISSRATTLKYHMYADPSLNTFDEDTAYRRDSASLIETQDIKTETLQAVLDKHLPANQAVDFFSIDVEDLDIDVLRSNDFSKYRPKAIVIEVRARWIDDLLKSDINQLLVNTGYRAYAKTLSNAIFIDGSQ